MIEGELTQSYLKEALTYNPESGEFVWKDRPKTHFKTEFKEKQDAIGVREKALMDHNYHPLHGLETIGG